MSASNIHFQMGEQSRAVDHGGIDAMHPMGQGLGLAEKIDARRGGAPIKRSAELDGRAS